MVTTETLEGIVNQTVSYHFDVADDVLYMRLISHRDTPTLGEETEDGLIELHDEKTGNLIGITVVSWWKRLGQGALPDSIREIEAKIERIAERLSLASSPVH